MEKRELSMILLISLLGFFLRVINLNQSLWLDEAISVLAAKNLDLWSYISKYPIGDFHPPGYFLLLWLWGRAFGWSEISARLPSVILGVLSIYLTYLIGQRLLGRRIGLLGAFLLAINPLHVYYSQEARMYSLSVFSASLSFYLLTKISEKKPLILLYILSIILVFYSDYLTYLIIIAQLIYISWQQRLLLRRVIISLFVATLAVFPWLPTFDQQLLSGREAAEALVRWNEIVGGINLKNIALTPVKIILGRISFDNKVIYGILSVGLVSFYGAVLFSGLKKLDKSTKLLLSWIVVPLTLSLIISLFVPVFSYFRVIFIIPPLCLLLSKGINQLPQKFSYLVLTSVIVISSSSLTVYYTNPRFQREDWKNIDSKIPGVFNKNSIVLFEDNHLPPPFLYYFPNSNNSFAGLKNVPAKSKQDLNDVVSLSASSSKVFLSDYLVEITDEKRFLEQEIVRLGFKKNRVHDVPGVGMILEFDR